MRQLFHSRNLEFELLDVDILSATDGELQKVSDEAGLALNIDEMNRIKSYFKTKGRNPTDVELQSLGQAWSEHCCYKSSMVFLREYLRSIESDSVIDRGDAGVVEFDEDHAFLFSPQRHQQFVMPSHRELNRHFDYAYIHLHSTQLHTLDNLLELDTLAAIELSPDYGASIPDLIPTIAKIQACKPIIFHGYLSAQDIRMVRERVPPEGLCLVSRVDTPEEAVRLQRALSP